MKVKSTLLGINVTTGELPNLINPKTRSLAKAFQKTGASFEGMSKSFECLRGTMVSTAALVSETLEATRDDFIAAVDRFKPPSFKYDRESIATFDSPKLIIDDTLPEGTFVVLNSDGDIGIVKCKVETGIGDQKKQTPKSQYDTIEELRLALKDGTFSN